MSTIKAGDLLFGKEFYKVLKVTAKTMVVQMVESKKDRSITFDTNNYSWWIPTDEPIGEPFRCALKESYCEEDDEMMWWIPKHNEWDSNWVTLYDGKPLCMMIWNYGDSTSYIAFDQALYDSAK